MENKTGKYFKYAVGEIVLVVVGILIALQINNWNESKKSINKTEHLLTQIHKELAFNIKKANSVIRSYRSRDSIIYKVLNKKVTYQEYKNYRRYSGLIQGVPTSSLVDNAFNNLMNFNGDLTFELDSIVSKLIPLYTTNKTAVDIREKNAIDKLYKFVEKLKDEKSWYYNYMVKNENTDEMIDYFLNDPIYLNQVTHYQRLNLGGHNSTTLKFRNNAINLYTELSNYLTIKKDTSIIKNFKEYEHYLGKYVSENGKIESQIINQNDNLIWSWKNLEDTSKFGEINLYPDTKTYFTISNRAFGKLVYDENNEVSGFIRSLGSNMQEYNKIE